MKRTRRFRLLAAGVAVAVSSGVVVTTTMQPAAAANDYQIIADNIDDAVGALAAGLSTAVDVAIATNSAVAVSDAIGQAFLDAAGALVAGTAQFGALGFGLGVVELGFQGAIFPYLNAIDDPSTVGDLLSPDDVQILLDNLLAALGPALDKIVTEAIPDALGGDLRGFIYALMGGGVFQEMGAITGLLRALVTGSSFGGFSSFLGFAFLVGLPAFDQLAGAPYLYGPFGDSLAPLVTVLAPVTSVLAGLTVPSLDDVLGGPLLGGLGL